MVLTSPYAQLDAGERQRHLALWARRRAVDSQAKARKERTDKASEGESKKKREDKFDPKENGAKNRKPNVLTFDEPGVAFAYGGVDPGTMHARGHVIKNHTVRYSVGLAGKYRLHVGLRQQGVALPGSPFLLTVVPGSAHAPSTQLNEADLPLRGTIGSDAGCSTVLHTADRMGNFCDCGEARVTTVAGPSIGSKDEEGAVSVKATVHDNADGTYKLRWTSETAGTYPIRIMIDGVHVSGSPTYIALQPGPPDVMHCTIQGEGLKQAQAGLPAELRVLAKDQFGNVAHRSEALSFGLVLLPSNQDASKVSRDGGKNVDNSPSAVLERANAAAATAPSMPFEGSWEGDRSRSDDEYDIRYHAQEAGEFDLHVWMDPDGSGARKWLVGSPYLVRVSGVRASPVGSLLMGTEAYMNLGDELGDSGDEGKASAGNPPSTPTQADLRRLMRRSKEIQAMPMPELQAGERLFLNPQLRDDCTRRAHISPPCPAPTPSLSHLIGNARVSAHADGNASFATEGALKAFVDCPTGTTELALKQLRDFGAYELTYDLNVKGKHIARVELNGEPITGSPFEFMVVPSAPVVSKSTLRKVGEAYVGKDCLVLLETADRFGNSVEVGGTSIQARAVGTGASTAVFKDNEDGTYAISFTSTIVGDTRLIVKMGNQEMSPLTVLFVDKSKAQEVEAGEDG